jgi:hypothetical protein
MTPGCAVVDGIVAARAVLEFSEYRFDRLL